MGKRGAGVGFIVPERDLGLEGLSKPAHNHYLRPETWQGQLTIAKQYPEGLIIDFTLPEHRTISWQPGRYAEKWWNYSFYNGGAGSRAALSEHGIGGAPDSRTDSELKALRVLSVAVREVHTLLMAHDSNQSSGMYDSLTGDQCLSILSAPNVLHRWKEWHEREGNLERAFDPYESWTKAEEIQEVAIKHLHSRSWGIKRAIDELSKHSALEEIPCDRIGGANCSLANALEKPNPDNNFEQLSNADRFHVLTYAITVLNENCVNIAYKQNLRLLGSFKAAGFSLDYQSATNSGMNLLMLAAGWGNEHFVEALLAAGANPLLKSKSGLQASDYAKKGGNSALSQQLLESESSFKIRA